MIIPVGTSALLRCPHCRNPVEGVGYQLSNGSELRFAPLCPTCVESEKRERQQHLEEARNKERKLRWETLCPRAYRETDAARLPQEGMATVLAWRENRDGRGLLLFGPTGRGKTRLVWLLLWRLVVEEGLSLVALAETEFAHQCGWHFARGTAQQWVEELCQTPILFLDDLGKATVTDRFRHELFHVIEHRTAHGRPIFLTTNLVGEELTTRLGSTTGEALLRRLREHCQVIEL